MKRITSALCAVFASFAIFAPSTRAAIDLESIKPDGFARGVAFTVTGYDANRAPLTNFPVLVRISEAGISGFDYDDLNFPSTGYDLGFVDAQGNGLAFDIDTWDNGNNATSLVWVTLPVMTNGTQFAMCYRSSKSGKMVCDGNAFTNYVGVWHLNEPGNSGSNNKITISDSSQNSLTAKTGEKSNAVSDGVVGGSRRITTDMKRAKEDQAIKVTYDSRVEGVLAGLGRDFSFSLWLRPQGQLGTDNNNGGIVYNGIIGRKSAGSTAAWHYQIADNVNSARFWTSQTSDSNIVKTDNVCAMTRYQWGRLDVVYTYETSGNVQKITAYWNGVKTVDNISPSGGYKVEQGTTTLAIGGYAGSSERPFCGDMDEVRIGTLLPSPDWVKADYDQIVTASFLSAGTVEEFVEIPKPVAAFRLDDSGAAFAQFGGSISALGEGATAASVLVQVWPTAGTASGNWTTLATGLDVGASFEGIVTNLTPQTAYTYAIKAVNDLTPPYDSDVVTNFFTTSGAGASGTGGNAKRVGDDIVHTFTVDPDEGDTWTFVPPSYATSVEALVVAGGGPGGYYGGAGGGAGGLLHYDAFPVTGGATYTVKVGAGGVASSEVTRHGTNGGDSLITSDAGATTNAIAYGGGAGGNGVLGNHAGHTAGQDGGSGGGSSIGGMSGENGVVGTGVAGQGNDGGVGRQDKTIGGGGGGAGGLGGSLSFGATVSGGSGGPGREFAIAGTATYYAGGGGGGGKSDGGVPGKGGDGGGGNGGMETANDADSKRSRSGTDGLGGGGGGGSTIDGYYAGANGGSGVVIIRYPIQGDGTAMPNPAISLTSATHDRESNVVSFTYRVAWAGYGYQVADVGIAWGYSPTALSTTNTVATDKIGSGSGTVQLPSVSKTVYLRAVATNKGGRADDSVETAVFTLFNPDAPVGTVSVSDTGVTNAVFSVNVTDLGTDASSASVMVEVCASEDFTGTVLSFPAAADLPSLGSVSVAATGLANNTAYYARAIVVNSKDVELTTDAVAFTTLAPGAPVGTAAEADVGLMTLSASVRVTSFGTGSDSATARLEISEVPDFSTLLSVSYETAVALNVDLTLTASGLSQDTIYYRRVRIRNWWGVDTYVVLPFTSTRSVPFSAAGPSWTSSGGTIDISLAVSAVYDGAACTAALTYGGEEIGTRTFDAAGTVTWGGLAAKADGTIAQIVVTTTVDGTDYSRTFSAPVTPGANATVVADVAAHASAANALWMRPGDVAALPDLYGAASYQVLNERFATISGSTLAALEPGIVGIRCVDASFNTNVMGVVILPDPIGSGSVYVFKETKRNNADDWSRPECWDKAENGARSAVNDSFPQNADDIAILPFYTTVNDVYVRHSDDITLGGLYAGQIRPDVNVICALERSANVTTKEVHFRRTDGGAVNIKVCPNGEGGKASSIQFGGNNGVNINVTWVGDILIDGCSSETDVNGPRGLVKYKDNIVFTNTAENATITVQGLPGYWVNGTGGTTKFNGVWKGSAEFVKKGQGSLVFPEDFSGLSGIVRDATGPSLGNLGAPAAGVLMRAAGASNFVAHVYGWPAYNHDNGTPSYNGLSRGTLATGGLSVEPAKGAQGPAKGLHMHGGTYRANSIDNANWGVGVKDEKAFDVLFVGAGLNYISLEAGKGNESGKPINAVTARTLAWADKGTLVVYDPSHNADAAASVTNNMFSVLDWADHAVGAAGDPEKGSAYPIVPWMAFNRDSNYSYLSFAAFDANGRTVRPKYVDSQIDAVSSPDVNAWVNDKHLNNGSETNIVVLSLFLNNANKNKWLGADRTLTISSGGLILGGAGTAIGLPGRDDNGALVLGNATHPGYVWVKSYTGAPARIWATVSAPGGFVSTYTGNLELGGDQRGIAGEVVVNSGTLALGDSEHGCKLANGLPVRVCAGATLLLPQTNAIQACSLKIDGAAGAFGKVDLSHNQRATALSVRDVFESDEWTNLPRGTYGSSESSALHVRDDIFTGPGVLSVRPYYDQSPFILYLR